MFFFLRCSTLTSYVLETNHFGGVIFREADSCSEGENIFCFPGPKSQFCIHTSSPRDRTLSMSNIVHSLFKNNVNSGALSILRSWVTLIDSRADGI
jgi:hypothetical protein